jgi:hypothetical protein
MDLAPTHSVALAAPPPGPVRKVWGTLWRVLVGALGPVFLYAPIHIALRPHAGVAGLAALECVGALVMAAGALLFAWRSKLSVEALGLARTHLASHVGLGVAVGLC